MNLRKIFNVPTKEQAIIIAADEKVIMNRCDDIARAEMEDQQEAKRSHDGQCPSCKEKQSIVDKISNVHGKNESTFRLGYSQSVTIIETEAVNHCNKCGNEWKKFKTKPISQTQIIRLAFKYLHDVLTNPNERKISTKLETIAVFEGCSAEAIKYLCVCYSASNKIDKKLTLSYLRNYYKSVYYNKN